MTTNKKGEIKILDTPIAKKGDYEKRRTVWLDYFKYMYIEQVGRFNPERRIDRYLMPNKANTDLLKIRDKQAIHPKEKAFIRLLISEFCDEED